jgi:Domain of unknown function (DUF4062)
MNQLSVFVSCVPPEFRQTRSRIAAILIRLGYTPVIQEIFGTEPGDLLQVLRDKIEPCEGLIQIVGYGYGAEPPTIDVGYGRVSYTQFEFLYARSQKKRRGSCSLATPGPATSRWTASTFLLTIPHTRTLPATRLNAAPCNSPTVRNGKKTATFTTSPLATRISISRSSASAMNSLSCDRRSTSGKTKSFALSPSVLSSSLSSAVASGGSATDLSLNCVQN